MKDYAQQLHEGQEADLRDAIAAVMDDSGPRTPRGKNEELVLSDAIAKAPRAVPTFPPPTPENVLVPPPAPIAEAGFYGLAGDVVRAIEPHSEADPAALLIQFLAAFGNMIGRCGFFRVEGDFHYSNLFVVVVGKTAKARKGTSWGQVRSLLDQVDELWVKQRTVNGLASGEGLIWAVRDPAEGKKGATDPGVEDKRLFVIEPEFARVLEVAERTGNTLSGVIRAAWDCGDLNNLVKGDPTRATGAHISIVAHITADELRRRLSDTAVANGFGNRFLFAYAKRSKLLPNGGAFRAENAHKLTTRIVEARDFAARVGELRRDEEAMAIWEGVYPELTADRPGLFGAITARAEAQVVRLACIYALLDKPHVIRKEHMMAALAVWKYCEDSARFIFGEALGDSTADSILKLLRENAAGVDRTQISANFGRNKKKAEIDRALQVLVDNGAARMEPRDTEGRPVEVWFVK